MYTGRKHGCIYSRVRVMHRPCTRPVHSRVRIPYTAADEPCTRAVNMVVYRVHGRLHGRVQGRVRVINEPCTRPVYRPCTCFVCTARVHGRVPCTRACLRPVFTAVNGRVRTVYTAVHDPNAAAYMACTRYCTGHGHGKDYGLCTRPSTMYTSVHGPYTVVYGHEHGDVYGPCTLPSTDVYGLLHGRARAVYMVRP